MKMFKFSISYLFLIVSTMCLVSPAHALLVRMDVQNAPIILNEDFDVFVWADDVAFPDAILSFGFDVDYDPSEFSYSGGTVSTPFIETPIPGVAVSGSTFPGAVPALGDSSLLLATLSFTAMQSGDYDLGISSLDFINEGVFTSPTLFAPSNRFMIDKKVSVNVAAPVPEPATMLLFATGLVGLAAFRRKKQQ